MLRMKPSRFCSISESIIFSNYPRNLTQQNHPLVASKLPISGKIRKSLAVKVAKFQTKGRIESKTRHFIGEYTGFVWRVLAIHVTQWQTDLWPGEIQWIIYQDLSYDESLSGQPGARLVKTSKKT